MLLRSRTRAAAVIGLIALADGLLLQRPTEAHGISGNRLFPGTSAFDDPAVTDELTIEATTLKHPAEDGNPVTDTSLAWSFMRLLTPDIAIGFDNIVVQRTRAGFEDKVGEGLSHISLKGLLYKNEPEEVLISAGLAWGIGGSGDKAVGAGQGNNLEPGIFFGKGFGNLSGSFDWLRPFAVTGAITADLPFDGTYNAVGIARGTNGLEPIQVCDCEKLHWGFSIQYSTLYLNPEFGRAAPKKEPLNQFVPLVEFEFDSPRGQKTAATMNPGLAYVGDVYQVSLEAILPLNHEGGSGVGVRAQVLFFIDDIMPSVFGKPLLSSRSVISRVETFENQQR
jgi:hypothetical protein